MSVGAFHETVLHARRWTGDDAKAAGIVQQSLPVRMRVRACARACLGLNSRLKRSRSITQPHNIARAVATQSRGNCRPSGSDRRKTQRHTGYTKASTLPIPLHPRTHTTEQAVARQSPCTSSRPPDPPCQYYKSHLKGFVAEEILAFTFPKGVANSERPLPPGLQVRRHACARVYGEGG